MDRDLDERLGRSGKSESPILQPHAGNLAACLPFARSPWRRMTSSGRKPLSPMPNPTQQASCSRARRMPSRSLPMWFRRKTLSYVKEGSRTTWKRWQPGLESGGLGNCTLGERDPHGQAVFQQVEPTSKLINRPVVNEYVNRIGRIWCRNSDASPFTRSD